MSMADERYNRWQGLAITQLSVAVSLISGLSVAGLGFGASLLRDASPESQRLVLVAMGLLCIAAFCSCGAVVTRLLDFRLTARKVRKDSHPDYDKPLKIFDKDKDEYSRATWRLFWWSLATFLLGAALLIVVYLSVVLYN
jgi:hypothetical protein